MSKIEIDRDKPLNPGDIIELHFKTLGMVWLKASQIALVDWYLDRRKDFKIRSWSLPNNTSVIFEVEILKTNPVIVTAAVVAAAIAGVLFMCWLTLDKVYQIVDVPAGKIAVAGGGIGMAAAGIGLLALLLKK